MVSAIGDRQIIIATSRFRLIEIEMNKNLEHPDEKKYCYFCEHPFYSFCD